MLVFCILIVGRCRKCVLFWKIHKTQVIVSLELSLAKMRYCRKFDVESSLKVR